MLFRPFLWASISCWFRACLLGWMANRLTWSFCLSFPSAGITSICDHLSFLGWVLGITLRSSRLEGEHFLNWVISPVLPSSLYKLGSQGFQKTPACGALVLRLTLTQEAFSEAQMSLRICSIPFNFLKNYFIILKCVMCFTTWVCEHEYSIEVNCVECSEPRTTGSE